MKNIFILIFCCIATLSFSQKTFKMDFIGELKDARGIQIDKKLFNNKYTLVYNLKNKSEINSALPYFKEASEIYKYAFFNSSENKGLTLLVLIHSNKINIYEYPVFDGLITIPVYLSHNSKVLDSDLFSNKSILINSNGQTVDKDFNPSDLRIDLTKYLKRE